MIHARTAANVFLQHPLQLKFRLQDKALMASRNLGPHHINERYAVLLNGVQVLLKISACQDATVYAGVQRFHTPCTQPPLSSALRA